MKKTEWKSPALLFLTAVVWGVAFVAQSVGMDYVGPFTFNCIRCLIGAVVLVPCIWFLDGWKQRPDGASCGRESAGAPDDASCGRESTGAPSGASYGSHALLAGGICCGLALFVASNLQQIGIQYTTVGKAGFITALYIVMVPVFGIFLKKRGGSACGSAWRLRWQGCICSASQTGWRSERAIFWCCSVPLSLQCIF